MVMIVQSVLLLGSHMILPVCFLVSLWRRVETDRFAWLLKVLYTGTFLLFLRSSPDSSPGRSAANSALHRATVTRT